MENGLRHLEFEMCGQTFESKNRARVKQTDALVCLLFLLSRNSRRLGRRDRNVFSIRLYGIKTKAQLSRFTHRAATFNRLNVLFIRAGRIKIIALYYDETCPVFARIPI